MKHTIYQVDAFTREPFKGNPAAVYITDGFPDPVLMQNIAMEMNLSETAFVTALDKGFRIRYYTPVSEVELCGHATLSASHILYETGMVDPHENIEFHSKAGVLNIRKKGRSIIMDFPVYKLEKMDIPESFHEHTGLNALELYRSNYDWKLVLLQSEEEVMMAGPDPSAIRKSGLGELIVTAISSNKDYDFVVRCFVPDLGMGEDPVTGSAHCALAPFWYKKTGKKEFRSFQASKRSGKLNVKLTGERVEISGEALTVLKADLLV